MKNVSFVLAVNLWARLRGLLGVRPDWKANTVLVLAPCRSVHTWWMQYPIDLAFVDKDGVVLSAKRNVEPWRIISMRHACFVLERPSSPNCDWYETDERIPFLSYGSL